MPRRVSRRRLATATVLVALAILPNVVHVYGAMFYPHVGTKVPPVVYVMVLDRELCYFDAASAESARRAGYWLGPLRRLAAPHHGPLPVRAAAAPLGRRFGVEVAGGMVEDATHHQPGLGESHLVFSRANGLLADHPITRGRNAAERFEQVLTFTGHSMRGPADSAVLLSLSDTAVDRPATTPTVEKIGSDVRVIMTYGHPVSAKGKSQGIALEAGRGRVVMLGEAGMLSAQRDRRGSPVGINFPGFDNRQLALNIMHWLSRLL